MLSNEVLKDFSHPEVHIEFNAKLQKHNTLRLNARAILITINSINGCSTLIQFLVGKKIEYRLLGWGANQIVYNNPDWVYLKLNFPLKKEYLQVYRENYILPANTSLSLLTATAKKFGLKGWEVFTGIPASLGGAIAMNAGTRLGEFGDLVDSVKVMDIQGVLRDIKINKSSFMYRGNNFIQDGEIVISAVLKHFGRDEKIPDVITNYLKLRNDTQPISSKTCGCVFKNSSSLPAGMAIDALGLKGRVYKGLKISQIHSNFIENLGEADSESFLEFSSFIKEHLERYYGFEFELEVKV